MAKSTKSTKSTKIDRIRQRVSDLCDRLDAYRAERGSEWSPALVLKATGGTYSLRNSMLLHMQAAERGLVLSLVAGYDDWQKIGRQVRKGETSMKVLRPSGLSKAQEIALAEAEAKGEQTDVRRFYLPASVFDISQTDAIEASAA
jgi:antirestriction protein ArdC